MKRWFALLLLLAGAPAWAASHVFLVQDSGWMEPFYTDPGSAFKPLVEAVVDAAVAPGDALVLAAFDQPLPGLPSPRALLSQRRGAATPAAVHAALAALAPARKPDGALADTDLGAALQAALTRALDGGPGLVWIFTNNRNSPNNDQATAQRNREFYRLIHGGGAISKALAFPLRMPVQGKHYRAQGMMVYVCAAGAQGERQLDALLASGRLQRVLSEPPARLKPLDRDTVRLAPRQVRAGAGVALAQAADGTLLADLEAGAGERAATLHWQLENTAYPYAIRSAALAAHARPGSVTLDRARVAGLLPGAGVPVDVRLVLPAGAAPPRWSLAALRAAGSALVVPGQIEVRLEDQRLELAPAFRARMEALFPGDPLPEIFAPPPAIAAATAVLPLQVRVHYSAAPLALAGAAAAALSLAALGAVRFLHRPRRVRVAVDGEPRILHTHAGATLPIHDRAGNEVARLETTLFGHRLHVLREGACVLLGP